MQFSQIIAVFALAVATSALPQSLSFDETMAKIKLAHPGISDDDAHTQAVGFLDAIAKLQVEGTPRESRDIEKRMLKCCKHCQNCWAAALLLGACCL